MKRRGQGRGFSIEKVILKHMAVPDADQRLARALDLLLQVAETRVPPLGGGSRGEEPRKQSR